MTVTFSAKKMGVGINISKCVLETDKRFCVCVGGGGDRDQLINRNLFQAYTFGLWIGEVSFCTESYRGTSGEMSHTSKI